MIANKSNKTASTFYCDTNNRFNRTKPKVEKNQLVNFCHIKIDIHHNTHTHTFLFIEIEITNKCY